MIPQGKKEIGDKISIGFDSIALHNLLDTKRVRIFKRQARARQEVINQQFKVFGVLQQQFCHEIAHHNTFVLAVDVICVIQMEQGSSLWDI